MTHFTIKRQQERERRERLERLAELKRDQQRVDSSKNN
jgi:hypothetical protein